MSNKTFLLAFTIANCDAHEVEPVAFSSDLKKLKAKAELHCVEMDDMENLTVGKWKNRRSDWYAPVLTDGKDFDEMFYTITEVEMI